MKNTKNYAPSCKVNGIEFGSSAEAIYYPGNAVKEGDSFTDDQFEYVGKMGSDWQKGHLLAKSLGGHNEGNNMLPMKQSFNDGIFKSYEMGIKNAVDRLADIQKQLADCPVFLVYTVIVDYSSFETIKAFRIPTKISCNVEIYKQENKLPVHTMLLSNAFKNLDLDYSVMGRKDFDTK